MATLKGITKAQLDKCVKDLPVPITQHMNRCLGLGDFLLSKMLSDDDFINVNFNKRNLLRAIYYHDIGKSEIPKDNMILKYCKTKESKNIYYSHADKGIAILKKLLPHGIEEYKNDSFVYYLYQCVNEHHESVSGNGYPGKMNGKQLSLAGKVCAVIDRFDNCMFVGKAEKVDFKKGLKKFKEEAKGNLDERIVNVFIKDEEALKNYVNQVVSLEKNRLRNKPYGMMMVYQPIVNLNDRTEINFEAKMRINDPYFGLIKPGLFIPIAEQSNQINELLFLSLGKICRTVLKLNEKMVEFNKIYVHINAKQLLLPKFVQSISNIFDKYQVPADKFIFIVTIKEEFGKNVFVNAILSDIKKIGIKLILNEFGEQYATYDLVLKLPFDGVIISETYTKNLESNSKNLQIIKGMVQTLKHFNLDVICQNISTVEQESIYKQCGCRYVQGEKYSSSLKESRLSMYCREHNPKG